MNKTIDPKQSATTTDPNSDPKTPPKKESLPDEKKTTAETTTAEKSTTTPDNQVVKTEETPAESTVTTEPETKTAAEKPTEETDTIEITPKKSLPFPIKPGMQVSVHERITETNPKGETKNRIQIFTGIILSHKHGTEIGSTITVRKKSGQVLVEKIFPLFSPVVEKIEIVRENKVRRSKLYFLRHNPKHKLRAIKK